MNFLIPKEGFNFALVFNQYVLGSNICNAFL